MKKKIPKKRIIYAVVFAVLLLAAVSCYAAVRSISGMLLTQQEAKRWQGGSDTPYAQISCFLPVDQKIDTAKVNAFRQVMMKKFQEASLDIHSGEQLYVDAWSTAGKLSVSSALGKGDVYAYAVGGDFFLFHPLRLRNGSYISGSDLMKDRAVLDEETAWLLFGSDNVQGMSFKINGQNFIVAGVIEREDDFATKKAYTDGLGIFISYDAYLELEKDAGITCYEVVMPEPVKGFAQSVANDKFPIGRGEIVNNTTRFSFNRLVKIARQYGQRSMQNKGVMYPYWENAARYAEDIAALLTALYMAFLLLPSITVLVVVIRWLVYGKRKLEDELLPQFVENTEEAIRASQYAHLQKKKKEKKQTR